MVGFEEDGFLPLARLFTPKEADYLLAEATGLQQTLDPDLEHVIAEPDSREIRSIFQVHLDNEKFAKAATDPRVVSIAEQILGSEVYLHQSRINFKPAFCGKEFFWHSDIETWHMEDGMPRMRAVSFSISLTENNEFNGPLMLVRGSHKWFIRCVGETPENHYRQSLKKQQFGVPDREVMGELVSEGDLQAPKGDPGSVVIFDCNTMHASVANLSTRPRTNLFLVFNSCENKLVEPFAGTPPRPEFLSHRDSSTAL